MVEETRGGRAADGIDSSAMPAGLGDAIAGAPVAGAGDFATESTSRDD
jgi:hypothetical protein